MSKLSRPLSELPAHSPCVVIGSGYGGAIAASRLARAGQAVCVLERGREIQPGEFPDSEAKAAAQLQLRGAVGHIGDRRALFDLHVDWDISALRGCGLGGTSLINAGAATRPDPRVMEDPRWPAALRADLDDGVNEGFARAEAMLRPAVYPEGTPGFPRLAKLRAMERAAEALGATYQRVPINVHFGPAGRNAVGEEVAPCISCGDCCSGCNHRAKNTTAMTWLPDARNHGARIFCEVEVIRVAPRPGGWRVHLSWPGDAQGRHDFIDADLLVIAAGSLGSTEILLRSRNAGLPVSLRVGSGFTGNGDTIGFAYNCDMPISSLGRGQRESDPDGLSPGPCVAGLIERRGESAAEAIRIEEGTAPGAVGRLRSAVLTAAAATLGSDTDCGLRDELMEKARTADSLLRGPYTGASLHTQTWLGMAQDDAGGALWLDDDALRIHWPGVGDQPAYARLAEAMHAATAALGGTYIPNPIWSALQRKPLMTTHPLGGCPMGEDAESGAVDHRGRVFVGDGDATHKDLFVLDGSILPCAIGCNPLLLISALAERAMMLLARERGWTLDCRL